MQNITGYIKINSDEWEDAGTLYRVIEHHRRDNSAVELLLECMGGQRIRKVVPHNWIEWIEDGDW